MKIITSITISYTTIGSIHSDDGAEEIIDIHDVGNLGCTKIEEAADGYIIHFENGKEIFTNRYEQVTKHLVQENEKYQDNGAGKAMSYVMTLYLMKKNKRVNHYLLFDHDTSTCVSIPESQCTEFEKQ